MTEKISNITLKALFAISIVIIVLFAAVGYDTPWEDNPKFMDPMFLDALLIWMSALVVATLGVTVWGLFNSLTTKGTGTMKETGLIAHTNSIAWGACAAAVVLGLIIGFAQKSDEVLINGKAALEEKSSFGVIGDRIVTDTIIIAIAVLMLLTFAATIWSFIPKKK